MNFSTRQAAQRLGVTIATLSRYITAGKVPRPAAVTSGGMTIHLWTDEDIEKVRKLLPKIKNGRKTRYGKNRSQVTGEREQVKPKKKNTKR